MLRAPLLFLSQRKTFKDLIMGLGLSRRLALRFVAGPFISVDDLRVIARTTLAPTRLRADPEAAERISHGRPNFFTNRTFCYYGGSQRVDGEWVPHDQAIMIRPDPGDEPALRQDPRFAETKLGLSHRAGWAAYRRAGCVVHKPINERYILRELSQYGAGLQVFWTEGVPRAAVEYARLAWPNKAWLYQAAGIPTVGTNPGFEATRFYEGRYINGAIAGKMTKTNTLGVVASVPIPEVLRNINSFTLGAQSSNPKIKTKVVWVNEWFSPPKETEAATSLINGGADVLFQNTDSPPRLPRPSKGGAASGAKPVCYLPTVTHGSLHAMGRKQDCAPAERPNSMRLRA